MLFWAPCTLKETDEIVDKFSTDLNHHYIGLIDNTKKLLEPYFSIDLVKRIYPDELDSWDLSILFCMFPEIKIFLYLKNIFLSFLNIKICQD